MIAVILSVFMLFSVAGCSTKANETISEVNNIDEETTKVYNYDEKLPWDMIDTGINKEWLKNEYKKAKNAQTTVPCETKCSNCGVCTNFKTHKVLDK